LKSEFEVTASDGGMRRLRPGDVLLIEDTWVKGHSTREISNGSGLIFAVVLAESKS
jgi:hypothetical protein